MTQYSFAIFCKLFCAEEEERKKKSSLVAFKWTGQSQQHPPGLYVTAITTSCQDMSQMLRSPLMSSSSANSCHSKANVLTWLKAKAKSIIFLHHCPRSDWEGCTHQVSGSDRHVPTCSVDIGLSRSILHHLAGCWARPE